MVRSEQIVAAVRRAWPLLAVCLLVTLLTLNRLHLLETRTARAGTTLVQSADLVYVPDTRMMRVLMLGYDQAAADVMWLRTLDYFARHLASDRRYRWLEYFLDQIIELDPKFRKVYHWAGTNVLYGRRFTNPNVRLSSRFYELALEKFPDDYEAAYRLGLNYYIEMRADDPEERRRYREKGLSYLERAANTPGAPDRLRSMVAAISSRLGKKQLALQYLIDMYIAADDPRTKEDVLRRIEALKAEIGETDYARDAATFERHWKQTFPYVSPALYMLMGEPTQLSQPDVDWRTLLPDIDVDRPGVEAP